MQPFWSFSFSESNSVVFGVKLSIVGTDEDISEDPQRTGWYVDTHKSTQADTCSCLRHLIMKGN